MSQQSGSRKKGKKGFNFQSLAAWGGWVGAIVATVTAWANCSNADTNYKNFLAQQKSRQDLEQRVRAIEAERDTAKAAATQAQAEAAKSADQLKRSLDHFVDLYRKAIDTANDALKAQDAVEARKGTLSNSDYRPMHENAMLTWRGSLRALVKVVENGRQILTPLNNLLDSDVDTIRGGADDIDQNTLRELFIKVRDSVDSKVAALNQALTTIAQMN